MSPQQRDRVLAALGLSEAGVPDVSLVGLATLDLLGDAATRAPLLLLVEDAQWLDPIRATSTVSREIYERTPAKDRRY